MKKLAHQKVFIKENNKKKNARIELVISVVVENSLHFYRKVVIKSKENLEK